MKKILMVLFVLFCLFSVQEASAQTYKLTLKKQDGIYYARQAGKLPYKSSQFSIYMLDDNIAYCIEPSNNITTYNYVSKDGFIDLPYSDELKEKLELIGYYGREYPGHDDVRYSMAAQALIWELTGTGNVTFWTERYEKGTKIDVSKEREEIMNLVNNHMNTPDLGDNILAYLNHEIVLKDKNNLLSEFEIYSTGGNDVTISENNLILKPLTAGESVVMLKRKHYDANKTILFVGSDKDNSQTLGKLRFSKEIYYELHLNTKGSKIKINKLDEDNNKVKLAGIDFKIKDLSTNNYICETDDCLFKTNQDGEVITDSYLVGEFEIEEVENQIIRGYTWNSEKIKISINNYSDIKWNDNVGNYIDVNFRNKKVSGILELEKIGEAYDFLDNDVMYKEINLSEIEFLLYDDNDQLIDTIVTDSNGKATYRGLHLGKYYLMEKTKLNSYVEDNKKYYFEIKQDNQYDSVLTSKIQIKNYLKKGCVDFTKSDLATKEGIPNTIIEIYNDKDELLLTRETDENGKVIISNIPIGKYYIIEKEANSMYQITNEKVFFEIKENNEVVKANMTNEKIVTHVPKTSRFDNDYINVFCGFFFFLSLGRVMYEKRKAY